MIPIPVYFFILRSMLDERLGNAVTAYLLPGKGTNFRVNRYHVRAPSKLACSSRCESGPGKA